MSDQYRNTPRESDSLTLKSSLYGSVEIKGLRSARVFSQGRVADFFNAFSGVFAFTLSRVYALCSLTFGLLTLILHLADYYFRSEPQVELSSLLIGVFFALLSIPLFFSDKPISLALQSNRLTDFVIFEFFSVTRATGREQKRSMPPIVGVILGAIPAVVGYFFSVPIVVGVMFSLVFIAISLVSPELPYIFSLVVYPFLPMIPYSEYFLAGLIVLTIISFFRKVILGKRVYALEIYDALIIMFILAVTVTGVILGGSASTEKALLISVFSLGYIPAANLPVNRRLCDCVTSAVVASSVPVSLLAITDFIVNLTRGEVKAVSLWFDSSSLLAAFLIVSVLFAIVLLSERREGRETGKRVWYIISIVLALLATASTLYFALVIALVLLFSLVLIIRSPRIPKLTILPVIAAPFLLFLLDGSVLLSVSDHLGISPPLSVLAGKLGGSFKLFLDNIFLGIGAYGFGYGVYSEFNLYLGIGCRFGIFALVVFIILLIVRMHHLWLYGRFFKSGTVGSHVEISSIAIFLLAIIGAFCDVFSDATAIYFFVAVFALGSASLRASRKERDLRLSYYKDLRSSESSVIDVTIRR